MQYSLWRTPLGWLAFATTNERTAVVVQQAHVEATSNHGRPHWVSHLGFARENKQSQSRTLCLICCAKYLGIRNKHWQSIIPFDLCATTDRACCNQSPHMYAPGTHHVLEPRTTLAGNRKIVGEYDVRIEHDPYMFIYSTAFSSLHTTSKRGAVPGI